MFYNAMLARMLQVMRHLWGALWPCSTSGRCPLAISPLCPTLQGLAEGTALEELHLDRVDGELSADNIATLCTLRSLKHVRLACSNADKVRSVPCPLPLLMWSATRPCMQLNGMYSTAACCHRTYVPRTLSAYVLTAETALRSCVRRRLQRCARICLGLRFCHHRSNLLILMSSLRASPRPKWGRG